MNGQFLGQDFNLLDKLPVTAYDPTPEVGLELIALCKSLQLIATNNCLLFYCIFAPIMNTYSYAS